MLSVELDFTRDTCLFDFKKLVAAKEGVRTEQVHLTIGGKEYPDTKKLMLVAHLDFVLKSSPFPVPAVGVQQSDVAPQSEVCTPPDGASSPVSRWRSSLSVHLWVSCLCTYHPRLCSVVFLNGSRFSHGATYPPTLANRDQETQARMGPRQTNGSSM